MQTPSPDSWLAQAQGIEQVAALWDLWQARIYDVTCELSTSLGTSPTFHIKTYCWGTMCLTQGFYQLVEIVHLLRVVKLKTLVLTFKTDRMKP